MPESFFPILRIFHVVAALGWVGEVIVINFVLLPSAASLVGPHRQAFMTQVFPRIFRLASVFSATAVITGAVLILRMTGGNPLILADSRAGKALLAGATLGTLLTFFHFFMERRVAPAFCTGAPENALAEVHAKLKILPRIGLGILLTTTFLMMYGVRGF
jgi:uncharacterized membrane protein